MRRMLLCAMAVVIGVATLAACGNPDVQPAEPLAQPPAAAATTPAPPTTPTAAPQALAFSAPLVGGGTIDMAEYAGKPVLLWFWAPT